MKPNIKDKLLDDEFTKWVETTYHNREHSTLGMKPIDRFGLALSVIRRIAGNPYDSELFLLESTRKVRPDNNRAWKSLDWDITDRLHQKGLKYRHCFPW